MRPSRSRIARGGLTPAFGGEHLADLARPVALEGRRLLHAGHAVLLAVTVLRGKPVPVTMGWSRKIDPVPLPEILNLADKEVRQALAAVEIAAQRLIAELMLRWPMNAVPPAIGIVTDGGGVVFSSDHPSPLLPDWLALHQSGSCASTTLLPFSENGAWTLLSAPPSRYLFH